MAYRVLQLVMEEDRWGMWRPSWWRGAAAEYGAGRQRERLFPHGPEHSGAFCSGLPGQISGRPHHPTCARLAPGGGDGVRALVLGKGETRESRRPGMGLVSPPHKGRSGLSTRVRKIGDDVWAALGTWKALWRQPVWLTKQEGEGRALWPLCQIHPPARLCRGAETLRSPALAIPEGRWGGGVSVRGSEEQTKQGREVASP